MMHLDGFGLAIEAAKVARVRVSVGAEMGFMKHQIGEIRRPLRRDHFQDGVAIVAVSILFVLAWMVAGFAIGASLPSCGPRASR
jgi:hypothetical protein